VHVPDGFFEPAMAVAAGAVSVGTVAVSVKKAGAELTDRTIPMAGICSAFIFAAQMVNFPVAAGTSGHLLGGALAAILLGPWLAVLCLTVVLVVQGLLFADGGLSALGLNVLLIGIVPAFVGWGLYRALRSVLRSRGSIPVAAGIAAGVSVPVAAAVFAALFVVGGAADVGTEALFSAMVGTHVLVGIGEGLITGGAIAFVLSVRADLIDGAGAAVEGPTRLPVLAGARRHDEEAT
jgi:cobalt/nickel transport system permease protein